MYKGAERFGFIFVYKGFSRILEDYNIKILFLRDMDALLQEGLPVMGTFSTSLTSGAPITGNSPLVSGYR